MIPPRRRVRKHGRGKAKRERMIAKSERLHAVKKTSIMVMRQFRSRKIGLEKARPNNPKLLEERVVNSIYRQQALPLIVFWGGAKKSPSGVADRAEWESLEVIDSLRNRLRRSGLETNVSLLFMDEYELRLNHRTMAQVERYRTSLMNYINWMGINLVSLRQLYEGARFNPTKLKPAERKRMGRAEELYARLLREQPEIVEQLERLAESHGSVSPRKAVETYTIMHAFDDYHLDKTFPGAVYLSFGNPNSQRVISRLPTLFYYQHKDPGKRGEMGVPWMTIKE